MLANAACVSELIAAARLDGLAARANHLTSVAVVGFIIGAARRLGQQRVHAGLLEKQVDHVGLDHLDVVGFPIQLRQQCTGSFHTLLRAADLKQITPAADVHAETLFEVFEILVEWAAQCSQALRIVGF